MDKRISDIKIERVATVTSLTESDEKAYWHSKTPAERMEAMELMRQLNYGYDPATARLQKVITIIRKS